MVCKWDLRLLHQAVKLSVWIFRNSAGVCRCMVWQETWSSYGDAHVSLTLSTINNVCKPHGLPLLTNWTMSSNQASRTISFCAILIILPDAGIWKIDIYVLSYALCLFLFSRHSTVHQMRAYLVLPKYCTSTLPYNMRPLWFCCTVIWHALLSSMTVVVCLKTFGSILCTSRFFAETAKSLKSFAQDAYTSYATFLIRRRAKQYQRTNNFRIIM